MLLFLFCVFVVKHCVITVVCCFNVFVGYWLVSCVVVVVCVGVNVWLFVVVCLCVMFL